jgi:hypothetical protein
MNDLETRHYYLGPASHSLTKEAHREHSEETEHTFPIRDADNHNKAVGHVTRNHYRPKWTFKIFELTNIPETLYDTKDEAWAAAQLALGRLSST